MTTEFKNGMLFVCDQNTVGDMFENGLFGLPMSYIREMNQLKPLKSALFLLEKHTNLIQGIFVPTTTARKNINGALWCTSGNGSSLYPSQIGFRLYKSYPPLLKNSSLAPPFLRTMKCKGKYLDKQRANLLVSIFEENALRANNVKQYPTVNTKSLPFLKKLQIILEELQKKSGDGKSTVDTNRIHKLQNLIKQNIAVENEIKRLSKEMMLAQEQKKTTPTGVSNALPYPVHGSFVDNRSATKKTFTKRPEQANLAVHSPKRFVNFVNNQIYENRRKPELPFSIPILETPVVNFYCIGKQRQDTKFKIFTGTYKYNDKNFFSGIFKRMRLTHKHNTGFIARLEHYTYDLVIATFKKMSFKNYICELDIFNAENKLPPVIVCSSMTILREFGSETSENAIRNQMLDSFMNKLNLGNLQEADRHKRDTIIEELMKNSNGETDNVSSETSNSVDSLGENSKKTNSSHEYKSAVVKRRSFNESSGEDSFQPEQEPRVNYSEKRFTKKDPSYAKDSGYSNGTGYSKDSEYLKDTGYSTYYQSFERPENQFTYEPTSVAGESEYYYDHDNYGPRPPPSYMYYPSQYQTQYNHYSSY